MKTLVHMNPIAEFRAMDDMLSRLFGQAPTVAASATNFPIDVYEREGKFVVKASVPGIDPAELDVQVEDNVLTIRGETKHDYATSDVKMYRREMSYGSFARSIRLPENLNLEQVDAEFSHGFVTISIPKVEEVKPKALKINVRQASNIEQPKVLTAEAETQ